MGSDDELMRSLTRRAYRHWVDKTTDQAPDVMHQGVDAYLDEARWAREVDRIFKRLPLALCLSQELPAPNTYRALDVMGVPVMLTRGSDGAVRSFLNVCKHRGAVLRGQGAGTARRFACPYHAWVYDPAGDLVGMFGASTFGDVDRAELALTPLPCAERAGFVWVVLSPGTVVDIDDFLGDFAPSVENLGLDGWHVFEQRELDGPGWKVAWDGYLEGYHQEALHPTTVGATTVANLMVVDTFGPHQRIVFARKTIAGLVGVPEADWPIGRDIRVIHSAFPNLSISGVQDDHCLVSQVYPGPTVDSTRTVQTVLCRRRPETEDDVAAAERFSAMVLQAVRDEDYWVGSTIQGALRSGANHHFVFGRNELTLQHYHRAVARFAGESVTATG
jgi:phenylpropionate dioxygenase-like ring-hydroxylating dioxygenase large terminal subunit